MKKTIRFILLIGLISSCNYHRKKLCKEVTLDDYSVDIKFYSHLDCGVFERIVLASQNGDLTYREKFKLDKLYKIHSKNNCEKAQTDTLVISLSKIQCDSIFDLANNYVNNTQFNIHVSACAPMPMKVVLDG
ncbi:MAG TPA: hypothetical protein VL443_27345, partial [Cyclobacteriaceae bacterium]|nr:hypothetical protein [Cyclobacteriaceae bacterium]